MIIFILKHTPVLPEAVDPAMRKAILHQPVKIYCSFMLSLAVRECRRSAFFHILQGLA